MIQNPDGSWTPTLRQLAANITRRRRARRSAEPVRSGVLREISGHAADCPVRADGSGCLCFARFDLDAE